MARAEQEQAVTGSPAGPSAGLLVDAARLARQQVGAPVGAGGEVGEVADGGLEGLPARGGRDR